MFTGLVVGTGTLRSRARRGPGYRVELAADLDALELGESIAVNGVCLTVAAGGAGSFDADVSLETVDKTTLGRLPPGSAVNLERSLRVGDRIGGHLVSGHVDGVARVTAVAPAGEALRVRIAAPRELARFIAAKGSVALDGVSLTVNAVFGDEFELMLIPHTQKITTLGGLAPGRELNLEVDVLARYVARQLETSEADSGGGLAGALARAGLR
ncbi:MAG: riboflavin synthase [Sorangiineae bacterium]|nr:riboflavin synthase [Polyangiaceae bacterium]MEB2321761.1 riboflavin synthase [Sorangiineae bacterium]